MYVIKGNDFNVSEWSGGITTELFIYPPKASYAERNFDFRISSASVAVKESTFTDFSGYLRKIVILKGEISLQVNAEEIELPVYQEFAFSGDDTVKSFGKCVDFNIIYRPNYQAKAVHISKMWEIATSAWVIIYNLSAGMVVKVDEAVVEMSEKELLVVNKEDKEKDIQVLGENINAIVSIID